MEESSPPNYQDRKYDINEVCSLTLVPKELPDGGMAFVLSGNPQKLFKEWRNLSQIEERVPTCTEDVSTHSVSPQSSSSSPCYSKEANFTQDQFVPPEEDKFSLPSTSYAEISLEQDKSYHTLQTLRSQVHYSPSPYSSYLSKPQSKTNCPPTPPPSPLTNEGPKAPYKVPLQPVIPDGQMRDPNPNTEIREPILRIHFTEIQRSENLS